MTPTLSSARFKGTSAALSRASLAMLAGGAFSCMMVVLLVGLELVKAVAV